MFGNLLRSKSNLYHAGWSFNFILCQNCIKIGKSLLCYRNFHQSLLRFFWYSVFKNTIIKIAKETRVSIYFSRLYLQNSPRTGMFCSDFWYIVKVNSDNTLTDWAKYYWSKVVQSFWKDNQVNFVHSFTTYVFKMTWFMGSFKVHFTQKFKYLASLYSTVELSAFVSM